VTPNKKIDIGINFVTTGQQAVKAAADQLKAITDNAKAADAALKHSGESMSTAMTQADASLKKVNDDLNRLKQLAAGTGGSGSTGGGLLSGLFGTSQGAKDTAAGIREVTDALSAARGFLGSATGGGGNFLGALSSGLTGILPNLGFAAAGIAAIGTSAIAAGAYVAHLVGEFGKAAEESLNMADRVGLSVGQVEKLQAMSRIAGVSIQSLEGTSRLLAAALEDTSGAGNKTATALQKMGVSTVQFSGQSREMGAVLLDVLTSLSKIPNDAERMALAQQTLGRASKELQPLIKNYEELQAAVEAFGVGMDESGTKKLAQADDEIDKLNEALTQLKKTLAVKFAPIEISIVKSITELVNGQPVQPGSTPTSGLGSLGTVGAGQQTFEQFARSGFGTGISTAQGQQGVQANQQINLLLDQSAAGLTRWKGIFDNTADGIDARIKQLKDKAGELQRVLGGQISQQARGPAEAEYAQTQAQIRQLEERAKSIKSLPEELKALQKELAAAQAQELEGVEKINALRKSELELRGKTRAEQDLINQRYDIEVQRELQKEAVQQRQLDLAYQLKQISADLKEDPRAAANASANARIQAALFEYQQTGKILELQKQITETVQTRTLAIQAVDEKDEQRGQRERADLARLQAAFTGKARGIGAKDETAGTRLQLDYEDQIRSINAIEAKNDDERSARRKALAQANYDYELRYLEIINKRQEEADKAHLESSRRSSEFQEKIAELNAGPGSQVQLLNEQAERRIRMAEQEYAITRDRLTLEKNVEDALYEAEYKRAELRKQSLEEFKAAAGDLFDSVRRNGVSGFGDFFRGILDQSSRKVVENIAGKVFEKAGSLIPDLSGLYGGIFNDAFGTSTKGTGGAQNTAVLQQQAKAITDGIASSPLATATTGNTTATDRNTAALDRLTSRVGGSGTGGGGGGVWTGLGALGGLFGGGTTMRGGGTAVPAGIASSVILDDSGNVIGQGAQYYGGTMGGYTGYTGASAGSGAPVYVVGSDYNPDFTPGGVSGTAGAGSGSPFAGKNLMGTGLTLAAGALGVYAGIRQGGAKGALNASSAGLFTAAALDPEPISKGILMGVAMISNLVSGFVGPNVDQRNQQIDNMIASRKFGDPSSMAASISMSGADVDYDMRGNLRPAGQNSVVVNIRAFDAKSVMDAGPEIADSVRYQVMRGHRLSDEIRQTM
jgi:hypothetical protein